MHEHSPRASLLCAPRDFGSPNPEVEAVYRAGEPAARGYRLDESGACVPADGETVITLEPVPLTRFARLERSVE